MFLADLLLLLIGTGPWQVAVLVALAMTITLLLNAGTLFVTQAAVQGIVVVTFAAAPGDALTRWLDALIGGGWPWSPRPSSPVRRCAVPVSRPRSSYAGSRSCCGPGRRAPTTGTSSAGCRCSRTPAPPTG